MKPTKIKIGDREYSVLFQDTQTMIKAYEGYDTERVYRGKPALGMVDVSTNEIWIYESQSPKQQRITLLHEIEHAILRDVPEKDQKNEENFVEKTSTGVFQVLRDNPELRDWLFYKENEQLSLF